MNNPTITIIVAIVGCTAFIKSGKRKKEESGESEEVEDEIEFFDLEDAQE